MSDAPTPPDEQSLLQRIVGRISLEVALSIIITVACLIVAVGYLTYLQNPNRKYDLARPGEKDTQNLRVPDDYEDSGPVDAESVEKKIDYLKEEIRALEGVNAFNPEDLSDTNIGFTAEPPTTE